MPKQKTNSIDKARQALSKAIRAESRRASKSVKRLSKTAQRKALQVKRAREDEYLARWRALKKLGLVNTKNPPAKKRLTSKVKAKINKEFFALQDHGHFAKGRVNRPLKKIEYKTPTGKKREKYELSEYFHALTTKKKTSAKTGIIKTGKGYIVEVNSPETKIRINKRGELVEKTGTRIRRRSSYKGKYIIQLIEQIERGRLKIKNNEWLVYRPWGSEAYEQMYAQDSLEDFAIQARSYQLQMSPKTFNDWLDTSEIMFITE